MNEKYTMVVRLQQACLGQVEHTVTVRNINRRYHCRVFVNGELNQEATCDYSEDIGYTCRSLLRWEDKCGNISAFANAARARLNEVVA